MIKRYNIYDTEKTSILQKDMSQTAENVLTATGALAGVRFAILQGLEYNVSSGTYGEGMVIMDGVIRSVPAGATRTSYLSPLDAETDTRPTKSGTTKAAYTGFTTLITPQNSGYPQLTEANVKIYSGWITPKQIQPNAVTADKIPANTLTNEKMVAMPPLTLKGNSLNSDSKPADLTFEQVSSLLGVNGMPDLDTDIEVEIKGMMWSGKQVYGIRKKGSIEHPDAAPAFNSANLLVGIVDSHIGALGRVINKNTVNGIELVNQRPFNYCHPGSMWFNLATISGTLTLYANWVYREPGYTWEYDIFPFYTKK